MGEEKGLRLESRMFKNNFRRHGSVLRKFCVFGVRKLDDKSGGNEKGRKKRYLLSLTFFGLKSLFYCLKEIWQLLCADCLRKNDKLATKILGLASVAIFC